MCLLKSRTVPVFDLQLFTTAVSTDLCVCVCLCASAKTWMGDSESVLCLRFAETGRGFADKRRGQVTAQRDYHKGREEGEKKQGTKDLPYLSLYTRRPSFHWLMAHKWKQTLKEKMKNTLCLRPSDLPWHPAQTLLCCRTTVELTNRPSLRFVSHSA